MTQGGEDYGSVVLLLLFVGCCLSLLCRCLVVWFGWCWWDLVSLRMKSEPSLPSHFEMNDRAENGVEWSGVSNQQAQQHNAPQTTICEMERAEEG